MRVLIVAVLFFASCRTAEPGPGPEPPGPIAAPGTHSPIPEIPAVEGAGGPGRESIAEDTESAATAEPAPLEVAATVDMMPTGVAVSREGRLFASFPRWGDDVGFTVAELAGGVATPYPPSRSSNHRDPFVSAQSVVVDPRDRLWVLDTGSVEHGPPRGAKLVAIDLSTNAIVETIRFPDDVVLPTTYLNDVRFDLRRGRAGMAYITDSSPDGPNAIIVVDLATKRARRRLNDHPSVRPETDFEARFEDEVLRLRVPGLPAQPFRVGVDGIALTRDGLFYSALTARTLYRVSLDAISDPSVSDAEVAETITSWPREFATDGLAADASGRIYLTDWENGAIVRFNPAEPVFETLVRAPELRWPDSLALAPGGWLYFTTSQLHRAPRFHQGKDLREQPYLIYRVETGAEPVKLDEART